MIPVTVSLGGRSYDVLVGPGARHRLAHVLPPGVARAAVVTQETVGVDVEPGVEWRRFLVGDGEGAKSLSSVEVLCSSFARWGLTRADVVVAVGGGVVTDLAGFAAATYHRGVALVNVATTLLAQVDAAVGGKTGVNLAEGKNLVGAFWQPSAVLCDTEVLDTLPPREHASGRGEMAKYSFLGAEGLEDLSLEDRVARCVALKAEIVEADERESGRRAVLNYGHTLAHALEGTGRFDLRHGEAVAVGLAFAVRLARRLGRVGSEAVRRHDAVLERYGLSGALPEGADAEELLAFMGRDKKAATGLTFVLDGPRGVDVARGVDPEAVLATLSEMGCR